jgi:hypothetical protein
MLRIEVDVFSGRPNPVITLSGREASEALERLAPVERIKRGGLRPVPDGMLGYRGLIIEQDIDRELPPRFMYLHGDLIGPKLSHRASDPGFEQFVVGDRGLVRRLPGVSTLSTQLLAEIDRVAGWRDEDSSGGARKWPERRVFRCAPLYEPQWWNQPTIQPYNNCYNYSANYRTDTFAQPGLAAGAEYTQLTCASVRPAAISDGLIEDADENNECPPEGHSAVLVMWAGVDFHWYRKGRNGIRSSGYVAKRVTRATR